MVTRYEEDFKKSIGEMVQSGRRPDELSKEYGPLTDSIRTGLKSTHPWILKRAAVLLVNH